MNSSTDREPELSKSNFLNLNIKKDSSEVVLHAHQKEFPVRLLSKQLNSAQTVEKNQKVEKTKISPLPQPKFCGFGLEGFSFIPEEGGGTKRTRQVSRRKVFKAKSCPG